MLRGALCAVFCLSLLSCALDLDPEEEDEVGSVSQASTRPGYWNCSRTWNAQTTTRSMIGPTHFECTFATCGDTSHSQPETWVDIVGGISQTCQDHSESFYGPYSGEWSGCSPFNQSSTGTRRIDGVNQSWDRWPTLWRSGRYDGCSMSSLVTSDYVRGAFATIYDLDGCINKQLVGTINWGDVQVTARLINGWTSPTSCTSTSSTGNFTLQMTGSRGNTCGGTSTSCNNPVCADLQLFGNLTCNWTAPQTCNAAGSYCNAYNNTNDSSCCSYYCYNFQCR